MPFCSEGLTVCSCGPSTWTLVEDVCYVGRDEVFTIKAGFVTDFASVPQIFTWLIPRYGVYTRAAVLHDYLCREAYAGRFSRADADGIFRRVLRELGVSWPRRWLMWAAVRVGGHMSRATALQWLQVLTIALVAIPLLAIPMLVDGVGIALLWMVEAVTAPRHGSKWTAARTRVDRGTAGSSRHGA